MATQEQGHVSPLSLGPPECWAVSLPRYLWPPRVGAEFPSAVPPEPCTLSPTAGLRSGGPCLPPAPAC